MACVKLPTFWPPTSRSLPLNSFEPNRSPALAARLRCSVTVTPWYDDRSLAPSSRSSSCTSSSRNASRLVIWLKLAVPPSVLVAAPAAAGFGWSLAVVPSLLFSESA